MSIGVAVVIRELGTTTTNIGKRVIKKTCLWSFSRMIDSLSSHKTDKLNICIQYCVHSHHVN
jgi:hypothetical protein